jgi:hypothetical protein
MYKAVRFLSGALNGAPPYSFIRVNKTWVVIADSDKRTNLLHPCVHNNGIFFYKTSLILK